MDENNTVVPDDPDKHQKKTRIDTISRKDESNSDDEYQLDKSTFYEAGRETDDHKTALGVKPIQTETTFEKNKERSDTLYQKDEVDSEDEYQLANDTLYDAGREIDENKTTLRVKLIQPETTSEQEHQKKERSDTLYQKDEVDSDDEYQLPNDTLYEAGRETDEHKTTLRVKPLQTETTFEKEDLVNERTSTLFKKNEMKSEGNLLEQKSESELPSTACLNKADCESHTTDIARDPEDPCSELSLDPLLFETKAIKQSPEDVTRDPSTCTHVGTVVGSNTKKTITKKLLHTGNRNNSPHLLLKGLHDKTELDLYEEKLNVNFLYQAVLMNKRTLKNLRLSHYDMSMLGDHLIDILNVSQLTSLELHIVKLSHGQFHLVSEHFSKTSQLTEVKLSVLSCKTHGKRNDCLNPLDLLRHERLTEVVLDNLPISNVALYSEQLQECEINLPKNVQAQMQAFRCLKTARNLQVLRSSNLRDPLSVGELVETLPQLVSLKRLFLDKVDFRPLSKIHLSNAMEKLECIDLLDCAITGEGLKCLMDSMPEQRVVVRLGSVKLESREDILQEIRDSPNMEVKKDDMKFESSKCTFGDFVFNKEC